MDSGNNSFVKIANTVVDFAFDRGIAKNIGLQRVALTGVSMLLVHKHT